MQPKKEAYSNIPKRKMHKMCNTLIQRWQSEGISFNGKNISNELEFLSIYLIYM